MSESAAGGISAYKQVNVESLVHTASPHQLISMLFDGAATRIHQAKGAVTRGDIECRSAAISAAVDIVSGLQSSLDHDKGGDLAGNLESLYAYMQRRLFRANVDNDAAPLDEVLDLLQTLSDAWQAIESDVMQPC